MGTDVRVTVIDKLAHKQYDVEPRQFEGRLLHQLPPIRTPHGDAYAELYLAEPADSARVALTRSGTRVIEDLSSLPGLDHAPWLSRYLQGLIDVPFLTLTPGTRSGIVQDERYAALITALEPVEARLKGLIEAQQRAEEEQAGQQSMRAIQRAFHEALLALPREEYDWFDVQARARREGGTGNEKGGAGAGPGAGDLTDHEASADIAGMPEPVPHDSPQRQFFDFAGPLFSVVISPASSTVPLNDLRKFRALPRDRSRRRVQDDLQFRWDILEGEGSLQGVTDQEVEYRASAVPGSGRSTAAPAGTCRWRRDRSPEAGRAPARPAESPPSSTCPALRKHEGRANPAFGASHRSGSPRHCSLISTSTPAGRSSFISASTVLSVGSTMSISRRWVRISSWSRDVLLT